MRAASGEGGFTLAEMLVSLALLAIAATFLAEGFASARTLGARMETRQSDGETVAAAEDLIRARIETLRPRTVYRSAVPVVDLQGTADRLELVTSGIGGDAASARRSLSLSPAGELVLEDAGGRQVLLRGVKDLALDYFGTQPGASRGWRDAWRDLPSPPELVRVRVTFTAGDRRRWPELIARPGAMVDTACVLDAQAACRGRAA
jgi:general secretion pathway protein J